MSQTILVVEDNSNLNRLFERKLTRTGYQTHSADSVREAINTLDKVTPHAIILDLELPDGNGTEVLDYMRNNPRFDNTLRVVVSGHSHESSRVIAQYKPDYVLLKPVSPRELMVLVNHELKRREPQKSKSVNKIPA